ncbi:hypothetical protein PR202_ga28061 [Eleusine coracana subsp. coracana]|uniref:F-box domain-containing protein n=1 Tax=Eleusine coracana subsp. coracana TaxID=191504 RepID=A0AAV5DGF5_ELECO|nr:hypothetical protein PR202_ga28061 [Eleusine coracana subsp. coracana]
MAAQSSTPDLLDELVEDILRRIPPHDPTRLFRAALMCKRWCRLVSDPGFRRRFRECHRRAPELGIIRNFHKKGHLETIRFVPTCSFCLCGADADDRHGWRAIDSRHNRVLLQCLPFDYGDLDVVLDVWDPITDV